VRLPDKVLKVLEEEVAKRANVVGWSRRLQKKIVRGRETDVDCVRIYVVRKVPRERLRPEDVIPGEIEGIPTDVVEVGEVKALAYTGRYRPLICGVSIGHRNITAGTLGYYFEYGGMLLLGSNAHVFTDDPRKKPGEVTVKEILQPGPYDGGEDPRDLVGSHYTHIPILPEGRGANTVDFAVAVPYECWEKRIVDGRIDPERSRFVGLLFAGSRSVTVVCKAEEIIKRGFRPLAEWATVREGDFVKKVGRTTGYTEARVIDADAAVRVDYGAFTAVFENQILTTAFADGGDSGSSVWI